MNPGNFAARPIRSGRGGDRYVPAFDGQHVRYELAPQLRSPNTFKGRLIESRQNAVCRAEIDPLSVRGKGHRHGRHIRSPRVAADHRREYFLGLTASLAAESNYNGH